MDGGSQGVRARAERRRSKTVSFKRATPFRRKLVVALPTKTPQFVQLFHLESHRSKLKCHLDLSGFAVKL